MSAMAKSKRRVCIVTFSAAFGGMESHTLGLAKTLRERGHDITILHLRRDASERSFFARYSDIDVRDVQISGSAAAIDVVEIRRGLSEGKGAIGVFPKGWFPEGGVSFDVLARLTFHRYITIEQLQVEALPPRSRSRHLGGIVPGLGLWWYRRRVTGWLRGIAPHCIVCVSEAVRCGLIENYRLPERKMITIPNCVDPDQY